MSVFQNIFKSIFPLTCTFVIHACMYIVIHESVYLYIYISLSLSLCQRARFPSRESPVFAHGISWGAGGRWGGGGERGGVGGLGANDVHCYRMHNLAAATLCSQTRQRVQALDRAAMVLNWLALLLQCYALLRACGVGASPRAPAVACFALV